MANLEGRLCVFPAFFPFITWLRIDFLVASSTLVMLTNKKLFSMAAMHELVPYKDDYGGSRERPTTSAIN